MYECIIHKSLIKPLDCEIKFYDNITGKSIDASTSDGNHGFMFRNSAPIQISYNEHDTCNKYVCRSLWYMCVNDVMIQYQISKYYCVFLNGEIFVLQYDDVLKINKTCDRIASSNTQTAFYVTPMITYDTMKKTDDVIVINEMYVINENQFECKTCAIKLNGLTLEQISELPMTMTTYGKNSSRHTDETVRNSKMLTKNLVIDIDLNACPNNDNIMIPCDNFEYIEYSQGQHFSMHIDRKRNPMHTHSILIYPPTITDVEGGELKLYPFGDRSMISITIDMPTNKWIGVIFPIDIQHESQPILNSGIKKIFKTTGSIVKTNFD